MWFEILPSFGIVVAAMAAPHLIAYVANQVVVGNMYRRSMNDYRLRLQYMRDRRLTGHPYKIQGLEALPDA